MINSKGVEFPPDQKPKPQPKPQQIELVENGVTVKTHEPDPVSSIAIVGACLLTMMMKG